MDPEIKEFTEGVGAFEPKSSDESYTLFRTLFKRSNYLKIKERFIIVKVSRSQPPFWGVGKRFLNLFDKLDIDYLLVLLVSGRDGWVFDKHDINYHIGKGYWKLNQKDQNYKINFPLKDKNAFSTHNQFLSKIGIRIDLRSPGQSVSAIQKNERMYHE